MGFCKDIRTEVCPRALPQAYSGRNDKKADICHGYKTKSRQAKVPDPNLVKLFHTLGEEENNGITLDKGGSVPDAEAKMTETYTKSLVGVDAPFYKFFLVLILLLFAARMIGEFIEVLRWLEIMIGCPLWMKQGEGSDLMQVSPISIPTRILFSLVLVIQFLMAAFTLWLGTMFLLNTTNYMELVLNALALTFVVEIDDALYAGMDFKDFKVYTERIKVKNTSSMPRCLWCVLHTSVILIVIVVMVVEVLLNGDQTVEANAIECLCQNAGENCLGARLWQNPKPALEDELEARKYQPVQVVRTADWGCFPPGKV